MIVNCVDSVCRSLIKSVEGTGLHHLEGPRIYSFIPLACAARDGSLPFSGPSSNPLLYTLSFHPYPPTSLPSSFTSSCHLFLNLPLSLVISTFIYNMFWGNGWSHFRFCVKTYFVCNYFHYCICIVS
jgi:hypothetical protein